MRAMSSATGFLPDDLRGYVAALSATDEGAVHQRLRAATAKLEHAVMQISAEQGRFMAWLTSTLGVGRAFEVGVFTGYSALCVAEQLPPNGILVACDVSREWTDIAKPYWEEAGVADRIDLRIGPAAETLEGMLADGQEGTFDFGFVDADKDGYPGYYEQGLGLLRPGGVLAFDNAFMGGSVADPASDEPGSAALRALNARAFEDERVDASLLPIGDGLLLVRKLPAEAGQ